MNCEQVEEHLSAYLDNMLAPEEYRALTIHLQNCLRCMLSLTELRQNDLLLAHLPRFHPSAVLYERIFSAPECVGQIRALSEQGTRAGRQMLQVHTPLNLPDRLTCAPPAHVSPSRPTPFIPLKWALAAALTIVLGAATFFGLNFTRPARTALPAAITPPAAGPDSRQTIPLAAGTRCVFLRDGTLWSVLIDGEAHQPERLTPADVTVAAGWQVNPRAHGHLAGDMLAYIDQQSARIHTIRSDGQLDTAVPQVLLKGVGGATDWAGNTATAILNSLAWSTDGSTLAFVGNSTADGQTHLYLYSLATQTVQEVSSGLPGNAAHLAWSPDSTRLAFTLAYNGTMSVLDYNIQSREVLNLSNLAASRGDSARQILTLGWSLATSAPAVTWSLGSIGRISSLWIHRVGTTGSLYPQLLLGGTYLQALYSPGAGHGAGSWLVVTTIAGRAGDAWHIDLTPGAQALPVSQGKQISLTRWSPDGAGVFYLDGQNNGSGSGHLVDLTNGSDRLLSSNVAANPAPTWSEDGRQLAYSAGTIVTFVSITDGSQVARSQLPGRIINLAWSPLANHRLIVVLDSPDAGLYLVDGLHSAPVRLAQAAASGIQWTEIP
ncbi:MAG TPA: zf-HC2 domain-containing protein [Ktedonobacteraceae bacterium]|jgi:WD40 repeat protein